MMPSRPRVAIDAHSVGRRATGNETYIRALVEHLVSRADVDAIPLLDRDTVWPGVADASIRRLRSRRPIVRLVRDLAKPRRAWGSDLLHVQYVRPPRLDVPCVTTVHDISYEHFPELFTRSAVLRMRATIPWSARHSAMVITGSSYSRTDLMERYGLSADRVAVTPYAADTRYRPQESSVVSATLGRLGLPTEYILYVGNLQPRKNIVRLLDAYVRLQGSRPPLVIAGQRAWLHTDIFATVRRHRLTDAVHFTGYLADGDLPAVYGGAMLFAYPSLFEGFGLPVLEAMACGTPTLASRTSSIPEVAGDGALLIDPLNTDEMVDGLQRLIQSNALRASLRARGLLQATRFSWDRCAEETVAVYQRALAR